MNIPKLNHSGFLPPFLGEDSAKLGLNSPYKTSLIEVAKTFATTEKRKEIFKGFLNYREALKAIGITGGFQWIDGSFIENCEIIRNKPPNDIDIVTFFDTPSDIHAAEHIIKSNEDLFDPIICKQKYLCDAYVVYSPASREYLINQIIYWYGIFSHQKVTYQWKGILQISLDSDDSEINNYLDSEVQNAEKT